MVDKVFIKKVEDSCERALCALGAKMPRKGTRYFDISDDILCWVGLNQGKHDEYLAINPFVGIHVIPVMQLYSEFRGRKYKKGEGATLSKHLGELCPDVEVFEFYKSKEVDNEAGRLAQTIYKFALPYAAEYTSIDSILPELEDQVPEFGGYPETYAISLYLANKIEELDHFLTESRIKYETEEDEETQNSFQIGF